MSLKFDVPGLVDTKLEADGERYEHAPEGKIPGPNQIPGYRDQLIDENGNGLKSVLVRSRFTKDYERAEKRATAAGLYITSEEKRVERNIDTTRALTAKFCVVDWEFTQRDGSAIECTLENREYVLSEPAFRRYADFIYDAVRRLQNKTAERVEADQGN